MPNKGEYQIRINLTDDLSQIVRRDPENAAIKPITDILSRHHATLKNQFDAFVEYVEEAERSDVDRFPLYKWTKATIEDPAKKAKHINSFSVHVAGNEVYAKNIADALKSELQPLVASGFTNLSERDTNPANNPQPPAHLRS